MHCPAQRPIWRSSGARSSAHNGMKRALLFLLALVGLPLVWALGVAFLEGLAAGTFEGPLVTPGRLGFLAGAGAMVALYQWKGRALQVVYVFAHEMTHAAVGLLFLARIHRVEVSQRGGFVQLNKQNLAITLAPYCVPFYLLLALGLCALVTLFAPEAVPFWLWSALFGFCTLFHVLYTIDALLTVSQPDVQLYGRLFSYWFILCTNLFFASLALPLSGQVPFPEQARRLLHATTGTYRALFALVPHAERL